MRKRPLNVVDREILSFIGKLEEIFFVLFRSELGGFFLFTRLVRSKEKIFTKLESLSFLTLTHLLSLSVSVVSEWSVMQNNLLSYTIELLLFRAHKRIWSKVYVIFTFLKKHVNEIKLNVLKQVLIEFKIMLLLMSIKKSSYEVVYNTIKYGLVAVLAKDN